MATIFTGSSRSSKKQLKSIRHELSQLTSHRRCYEYEDFVECCFMLKQFTGLKWPIETFIRFLQAGIWSEYPIITKLLNEYLDVSQGMARSVTIGAEKGYDKEMHVVNVSQNVSIADFTTNFLTNIKILDVPFRVPGVALKRRRRKAKVKAKKLQERELTEENVKITEEAFVDADSMDMAEISRALTEIETISEFDII
ncbi:hypothetical protein DASC09_046010 [Saccharomycopsis crataegensis]|uniref:Uncharacterized protein n=1 Tax=Saccharomycopsis crataegensis TaxID=43959 RepID=A0AAV5QRQ8_9ASCO|nr:hypothetical protein DASC09_046010 [Saccharomycopsis crataegensis]